MVKLDTPADIEHIIRIIQLTKWCNMSALVMYFYELLITFDEEVNFIWTGVFSPGKALFLLLRYVTLASLIFYLTVMNLPEVASQVRLAWVRFQWIAGSACGLMAHITLELRLYAMYNKSKTILVLLSVATILVVGAMFGILIAILTMEKAEFVNLGPAVYLHMCIPTNIPYLVKMFWIPILVGEGTLVGVAIYKGIQTHGETINQWVSNRPPYGFLRFLVRDSVLFFVMVFVTFLATELVWVFAGTDYIELPVGFAIACSSVWSQRLLLNIRKHREAPEDIIITLDSDIPESTNDIVLNIVRNLKADR